MYKLNIDDQLINTIIVAVAPDVVEVTHWDLKLPLLRSRVIQKDQAYEEIMGGRIRGAGIVTAGSASLSLQERLIKHLVEESSLAAYEPSRGEIIVVNQNLDDSNIDGLKLVMAHELVHRAQHVRYPGLFTRLDEIIRNCWYASMTYQNPSKKELREVEHAMTIIESHASFVQQFLAAIRFPLARIEKPLSSQAVLLRSLGVGKSLQYILGLPDVAEAVNTGTLDEVFDRLIS